jgi:outer membrane lipoprotein-sorting protein
MMQMGLFRLLIFMAALLPWSLSAEEPTKPLPTLEDVTKKLDDLYRSESSKSTVVMEIVNNRGKRTLTMDQWTRGEDNALIIIRKPAREAGTATLKTDEGLWNYAPRADRLIRVPSGLLSDSWMGSHFTNDDLVRESSYDDDFVGELSRVEEGGRKVLKVKLTPKKGTPVEFERLEYFLDEEAWVPIRADFYDKGKIYRKMEFRDVRDVDGKKVPFVMELSVMDKPGERTTISYTELRLNIEVPESTFTQQGLRRAAKQR